MYKLPEDLDWNDIERRKKKEEEEKQKGLGVFLFFFLPGRILLSPCRGKYIRVVVRRKAESGAGFSTGGRVSCALLGVIICKRRQKWIGKVCSSRRLKNSPFVNAFFC